LEEPGQNGMWVVDGTPLKVCQQQPIEEDCSLEVVSLTKHNPGGSGLLEQQGAVFELDAESDGKGLSSRWKNMVKDFFIKEHDNKMDGSTCSATTKT
jgi:hypothetical protein